MTTWPNISICNTGFTSDFYPKFINMTKKDPLSGTSLHAHYLRNQINYIPYYLIAVITTRQSSDFEIYDGVTFYDYSNNPEKEPIKKLQSIHYFAINCFELNKTYFSDMQGELFKSIDLTSFPQTFKSFPLNFYYPRKVNFKEIFRVKLKFLELDKTMIKGLNCDTQLKHDLHLNIAENIENEKIFSGLEKQNRNLEVIKWIWCSLKHQPSAFAIAFYGKKLSDIIDDESKNKGIHFNKIASKL